MEKSIDRYNWLKDLIKSEERIDETGYIDMSIGIDNEATLLNETYQFIHQLKNEIIDLANHFNELKSAPLGRIKIYGIAKTQADFMLFRNGYKMIFTIKQPGMIGIRFNFLAPNQYLAQTTPTMTQSMAQPMMEENQIVAKKGPFNDLQWTFKDQQVQLEAIVKYHFTLFVRESAK